MLLVASAGIATAACGTVEPTAADAADRDARRDLDAPIAIDARSDAAPDGRSTVTSYTVDGMWSCPSLVDCEDVYDFDLAESATVTAKISNVTNGSAPRLGIFAGTLAVGTNLFDDSDGDMCGIGDEDLSGGPLTLAAGHYQVTVGRDWGNSENASGTYTFELAATNPFMADGQSADDEPSNQGHCP